MENILEKDPSFTYQTVTVAYSGNESLVSPCPSSPPSSSKNVDKIDVRVGEVGKYVVYMCVWKLRDLVCAEPLKYTMTTLAPSYLGNMPNAFTSSDFSTLTLEGGRLRGWTSEPNNPFDFGVWRLDLSDYTLSTTGYACPDTYPEKIDHSTLVRVDRPLILFNSHNSRCGSMKYSNLDNTVGVTGENPVYHNASGCFVSYDIKNPSYNIQYGFLQTLSSGARVTMNGKSGLNEDFEHSILYLRSPAVNLFDFTTGSQKTISQKTKVDSNEETSISYNFKPSVFAAPYFHAGCEASDMSGVFNVTQYEDSGTQYYSYLMMKVSPQKGKESYWVPVKKSGWYSSYVAECQNPPCGLGLGEVEPYTRNWSVKNTAPNDPVSYSALDIPNWEASLQESYNIVSMTDFNEMDYWLSCPSSSYPFKELDSSAPTFHTEEL